MRKRIRELSTMDVFYHPFYRLPKRFFLQVVFPLLTGNFLAVILWVLGFVLFLLGLSWLDYSTSIRVFF